MLRAVKKQDKGFTLIELAVSIMIAGLMAAGIVSLLRLSQGQRTQDITARNMEMVVAALAIYVESSGRLPCPADPGEGDPSLFGWEWGVTAAGIAGGRPVPVPTCRNWAAPAAGVGAPAVNTGIVPFLTLGLDESVTRDAWGRYFTYAVSPVFAQNNDDVDPTVAREDRDNSDDQGRVHARCLDGAWYDNEDNVSAVKAKFCCAKDGQSPPFTPGHPNGGDIAIQHTDGTAIWPLAADTEFYNNARDTTNTNYVLVDPYRDYPADNDSPYVYVPTVSAAGDRQAGTLQSENGEGFIATPAFALISHGENGEGSFLANGTRDTYDAGGAGDAEDENANFDNVFADGPVNKGAGAGYFDDIVLWRTQDGIVAENGTSSCRYP